MLTIVIEESECVCMYVYSMQSYDHIRILSDDIVELGGILWSDIIVGFISLTHTRGQVGEDMKLERERKVNVYCRH